MRYGIPTGYKAKLTKRQTQQYAFVLAEKLFTNFLSTFNGLQVDVPQAVAADAGAPSVTFGRPISFDTLHSAKVHCILTDPGSYLVDAVAIYLPRFDSTLLTRGIYVRRDAAVSHTAGVCTQQIHLEGRVVAADAIGWSSFLHERMLAVLSVLRQTADQMGVLYRSDELPAAPVRLVPDQVRKQFWSYGAEEAIAMASQKHRLVFLATPQLLYEPAARERASSLFDPLRHVACYYYADACEAPLPLFEAGIRPDLPGEDRADETSGRVPTYFVRVNVSQLLMALLRKVHVAEVVPSVWSDDFLKHCRTIGLDIL